MKTYEQVFVVFESGDVEALLDILKPWLRIWAYDVLFGTPQESNSCWHEDLISGGAAMLPTEIKKRMQSGAIKSGEHLINSLRLAVRKGMEKVRRSLFVIPVPAAATMAARAAKGESLIKPWEPHMEVSLQGGSGWSGGKTGRREEAVDASFLAKDADKCARWEHYRMLVRELALVVAQGADKRLVEGLLAGHGSLSTLAARLKMPRTTARDRLRNLAPTMRTMASPELLELGMEFHPTIWCCAGDYEPRRPPEPDPPPINGGDWRGKGPTRRHPGRGLQPKSENFRSFHPPKTVQPGIGHWEGKRDHEYGATPLPVRPLTQW